LEVILNNNGAHGTNTVAETEAKMPRRFDAKQYSEYIKLLEQLALAEPERTADINMAIERLRALSAEHCRICDVRIRLAKRTKDFEQDCHATLLTLASIAISR
jgi:hypothetical protein